MTLLIKAGLLVSTSDMKLAEKLQQFVSVEEITGGKTPQALRQVKDSISFMHGGEFYELQRSNILDTVKLQYEY